MSERGNEKMTEWLDIKLETLSSEERIQLIEEICETLTPQELRGHAPLWLRQLELQGHKRDEFAVSEG
jgi:hypothetical protein